MTILIDVVLPVFLVIGLAALTQRRFQLDVRTLSRATFYLFSPALIFDSLARSPVSGDELGRITAALLLTTLILWVLGAGAARLLRLTGPLRSAFLIALLFMNAGNYGLPVTQFAFGEAGLARAAIFFTTNAVLTATLGVYLAARSRTSALTALRRLLGVPMVYAAVLGLTLNLTQWAAPEPLMKAVHLLGQAAVPVFLIVLGIQLAQTFQNGREAARHLPALTVVTLGRLVLAPTLGVLLCGLLGLGGLAGQVVVLESAMPTAVMTTVLATEFETDASFATLVVFVTTLASLVTVTAWLNWLM